MTVFKKEIYQWHGEFAVVIWKWINFNLLKMHRQFQSYVKAKFEKYVFFLKPYMFIFKQYILAGNCRIFYYVPKRMFSMFLLYLCRHYSCKRPLHFLRIKTMSLKDYVKPEYQNHTTLCLNTQWDVCTGIIHATNS